MRTPPHYRVPTISDAFLFRSLGWKRTRMALNGCAATLASDPTRHELHQCLVPFPHDATGGMFPPLVSHLSTLTLDRDGQLAFLLSSALRLLFFFCCCCCLSLSHSSPPWMFLLPFSDLHVPRSNLAPPFFSSQDNDAIHFDSIHFMFFFFSFHLQVATCPRA